MHITIFVYGTWGDIRPHVVLGRALQENGHEVQVVAAQTYETWVRERGLGFYPLSLDMNIFAKENAEIMEKSIFQQLRMIRQEMPTVFTQMGLETLEATRNSDVLITVEFGLGLLIDILRVNDIKPILINPAPLNPTKEFTTAMPPAPNWFPFPKWYNRASYTILRRITWSVLGKARSNIAKQLGVPKSTFKDYQALLDKTPALTSVSKSVVQPRPDDWAEHFQITGYLIDDDPEWTPPQPLVDFLNTGEPPVYIGFGSMPDGNPETTTQIILDAVKQSGKRAIILKGWAGLDADDAPDNVYFLDYAPHSWLFPKMAAVIHHGGSGTTASGLRAGVPTTIVPHNGDQPYWGRRLQELGVGTAPIPRKKLNSDNLSEAINILTSESTLRANAQALSKKIEAEDGLTEAMYWTQKFLAKIDT